MTKGFFTICEENENIDYVRMAYALALSLKITQKENNGLSIAITPKQHVPERYAWIFENIIELPWVDNAAKETWKLENEWKVYHITPYDETIKLDADMLFTSDISHWWDLLSNLEFWPTTNVLTFRNQPLTSNYYRKVFLDNNLPNIYTAFMYFQKTEKVKQVFEKAEKIFQSPADFFSFLEEESRPQKATTDVVFALALKLLDLEDEFTMDLDINCPTFVHMKPKAQNVGIDLDENSWVNKIPVNMDDDGIIKINTFKQNYPLHYHDKNFLSEEMLRILETKYAELESKV